MSNLEENAHILSITRTIEAPVEAVWRCWTQQELLKKWYCPKPWNVSEADFSVKPGGRMNMTMSGPDGERIDLVGSFLEVNPHRRLVFTDAYAEGYMPKPESFMTGVVEFSRDDDGHTLMVWSARHATAEARDQHLEMGFETGWSTAADQLNSLAKTLT